MVFFFVALLITGGIFSYMFIQEKNAQKNVFESSSEIVQQYEIQNKDHGDEQGKKQKSNEKSSETETPSYEANIKNLTNDEIKDAKSKVDELIPYVVGTIKAPSIELDLPIFEGFTVNKLALGAGTMKANQDINNVGNFALAGHNMNTNRPILFSRITQLKGKEVIVNYKGKKQTYKITGVYEIKPTAVEHIEDTAAIAKNKKMLTLITCTLDGKNRFMVQGEAK